MRHHRLSVPFLFLALVTGGPFTTTASAANAIYTQTFEGLKRISLSGTTVLQLTNSTTSAGTDWWHLRGRNWANSYDLPNKSGNTVTNDSITLPSNANAQYIASPPVSVNIGAVTFKVLVRQKDAVPATTPNVSIFLGSSYNYKTEATLPSWPNVEGVEAYAPIEIDHTQTNKWVSYTYTFNHITTPSDPKRVFIGRMTSDRGYDLLFDDIVIYEAVSTLSVEDDLYVTANSVEPDPAAATTAVVAGGTVAPHVSFTMFGNVSDTAVTLHYRMLPGGTWQTESFNSATTNAETGVITYALRGGTLGVGDESGAQMVMYATATYVNAEGNQSVVLANTEANPLRIDVLPKSPVFAAHTNLVVAGALEAPMDIATNGIWVGVLERADGVGAEDSWHFDFGEGAASTSRTYGDDSSAIPFKDRMMGNGKTFPAPTSLDRDVMFRYKETSNPTTYRGAALFGEAQTFENWEATQANGWRLVNTSGSSAVVDDASLAFRGTHALHLAAGDSLVLDKSALPGVKEVGFWMRRAGEAAASATLKHHVVGAASDTTLAEFSALPTDRYAFISFSLNPAQDPMGSDGITITANAPIYLDGVFVSDSSRASLTSFAIEPEAPLHRGDVPTVTATFSLEGGARFREGGQSVLVVWGQGNSAAVATNAQYASYVASNSTWTATLPALERGDADLYYYVTADAFDFAGDPIGTLSSATNCVSVEPDSSYPSLDVAYTVNSAETRTPLNLAGDYVWKGAVPAPASALQNVVFQFVDDRNYRYGGAEGSTVPGEGEVLRNGSILAATFDTAFAFEFDERRGTYTVRPAKYAPLDGALPSSGWTPEGTVSHTVTGSVFQANAKLTSTGNTGVGQVFFWAKRTTAANVGYTIEYNVSESGGTWSKAGISGATGTIASETLRFYSATVGNNNAKRIRISFSGTGAAALVQDVVVTASGAFVTFANPKIATSSTNVADAVASVTANGPVVAYGETPMVWADVTPMNGAKAITVNVEAVSVDGSGNPLAGAETAHIPMEGDPDVGGTFSVVMPALPVGLIGYRFVATYEGIDATQTTYPASGYYVYETDANLDTIRAPDFSTLNHNDMINSVYVQRVWSANNVFLDRFLPNSIGFAPEAGTTRLTSRQAFNGIGRIYFKAHKQIDLDRTWVPHYLLIQISNDGSTWQNLNVVEVPYGKDESADTQFCIEVNTYDSKYVRFVRDSSDEAPTCYLFLRDVVVTPPSANVDLSMPSIIHPGYPSQSDDITFRVDVESVYDAYPAVSFRPLLHWRRYAGATPGAWQQTSMTSSDGTAFRCTLPAMAPGRVEYYVETHFSGAAYDYTTSGKYNASMPFQFYYAWDDTMYTEDPKNGKEGSSPSYLYAAEEVPTEFSNDVQQRALYAPGTVEGDATLPYLWFKIRTFHSHHRELQFVYEDVPEDGEEVVESVVHTNALLLVGDETWLTTIPVTNSVHWSGKILGIDPYNGAGSMSYGSEPTSWGDPAQMVVRPPLSSTAVIGAASPIEVIHGMKEGDSTRLMVRLDTTSGSYQIRQAAYQNFNDWSADPTYFEDSTGLYDTLTYEEAFDGSSVFPETAMRTITMDFSYDQEPSVFADPDEELLSYNISTYDWRLRNGWIIRERNPATTANTDKTPNLAAMIEPHAGYLENTSGGSALFDGLDTISFRYRASIGGNGHLPYYKDGFAWQNYTFFANNVRVTQMSPAHPYIQVIAGYADEDNYVAMRLTQMRELDNNKVNHWVKQELIQVRGGVERVLSARKAQNFAAPSGNVMSNRFDNLEMDKGSWYLSLSVTNNSIEGKAYPSWATGANKVTNVLYAANTLAGTDSADGGTISFDAYDALASFKGISVKGVGDATNFTARAERWNLGGTQKGGAGTRWETTDNNGVANKIPPLPFTIGVCKAGTSESFPGNGIYETVYTGNANTLAYGTQSVPIHYWGNTFVRIETGNTDARLVVDDVETKAWHGKALPENDSNNLGQWQAREAVVVTHKSSRQLALTTSRANPDKDLVVYTPEMLEGIGTISFNYEVVGGDIVFAIERNMYSGAYDEADDWVPVDTASERITAHAGEKGEVFRPIRKEMTGRIRVRVLQDESGEDATLYIDNLFAKGYPPDDGSSWTAYNALIVAPTRNATTDSLQFEEDVSTQTAFLNRGPVEDTRPNNPLEDKLPNIQSPVISTGIGEIGFWYRVWNPSLKDSDNNIVPGKLTLWVATDTSAEEREWRQITVDDLAKPEEPAYNAPQSERESYREKLAAYELQKEQFDNLSCITNGSYRYFTAEICNDTNYVLRICCDTNGTQRVAIDNVLVTEPVRASIDILSVGMYPNDIPLGGEPVGFEVRLGNPRMNPTDIHVFAEYFIGTNVWGVANWSATPTGAIQLEQDADDEYLYRSAAGDMIPGLPVDSVVQYRVRVTYTGTFASPVLNTDFTNPPWYEPIDLNEIYGAAGNTSPYYWVFSCPTGVVHINEFYPSFGASYNTREFVELIGPANLSLEGWKLDVIEGRDSEFEDAVNVTYTLPAGTRFSSPEGSTRGWGFFVIGDDGEVVADKVDLVWANPEQANLPPAVANRGGGLRLRRSMGAYVDRVSYGGSNNGNPATAMVDRGFTYAGTRLNIATYALRAYSLETTPGDEGDEWAWNYQKSGTTLGEMNTEEASELLGDCPFVVSGDFANATAEAISEYFDKHVPADFLIRMYYNSGEEITKVTVDRSELALGTGYTLTDDKDNEGAVIVTLDADALAALDLSTNDTHTVLFTMKAGSAPSVTLVVKDSTSSSSGNRSTRIVPSIKDFRVENGEAVLTLTFINEGEAGTTASGWKWAVVNAATIDFKPATTNDWTELSDADIGVETGPVTFPSDGDAQFYKVISIAEP